MVSPCERHPHGLRRGRDCTEFLQAFRGGMSFLQKIKGLATWTMGSTAYGAMP